MSRRGVIRNVSRLNAVRVFGNLSEIKEGGSQTETGAVLACQAASETV